MVYLLLLPSGLNLFWYTEAVAWAYIVEDICEKVAKLAGCGHSGIFVRVTQYSVTVLYILHRLFTPFRERKLCTYERA